MSDESGTNEIYVQPFPSAGRKLRISTRGGTQPIWRPDGRALFFIAANGALVEAELSPSTAGLEVRETRPLFIPSPLGRWLGRPQYAVAEDGRRFLFNIVVPDASPKAVTVLLNWNAGAK